MKLRAILSVILALFFTPTVVLADISLKPFLRKTKVNSSKSVTRSISLETKDLVPATPVLAAAASHTVAPAQIARKHQLEERFVVQGYLVYDRQNNIFGLQPQTLQIGCLSITSSIHFSKHSIGFHTAVTMIGAYQQRTSLRA